MAMKKASDLLPRLASSPKECRSDAVRQTHWKFDTRTQSNSKVKETLKQFYIDNALQMLANWCKYFP